MKPALAGFFFYESFTHGYTTQILTHRYALPLKTAACFDDFDN